MSNYEKLREVRNVIAQIARGLVEQPDAVGTLQAGMLVAVTGVLDTLLQAIKKAVQAAG